MLQTCTLIEGKIVTEETIEGKTVDKRRNDGNVIYVGSKPPMSYVLAVITQFQSSGSDEVIIKARGRSISTAVDTAEIVRNRFMKDAKLADIKIGTESITNEEGRTSNVSSMEIILTTKKKREIRQTTHLQGTVVTLFSDLLGFYVVSL